MNQIRIALAQLNPTVGDIDGNRSKIGKAWSEAKAHGAALVVASELCLTGYPPEDLAIKPSLMQSVETAIDALARETANGPALLIGTPWRHEGELYNAALLLDGGRIAGRVLKHALPNSGCFDEKRIFEPGPLPEPIGWNGHRLGVMVCEDMWTPPVTAHLAAQGAQILIVPNGSPYETDKLALRHEIARFRIEESGLPLIYVNQYGGQDELIFDGASFAMDGTGEIRVQMEAWREAVTVTDWDIVNGKFKPCRAAIAGIPAGEGEDYHAILTGLRDYVTKNGFGKVLLGLSGGIDSALVAAMAADALGADRLHAVMMPSPYTSQESLDDAAAIVKALGCRFDTIPILPAMKAFQDILEPVFVCAQAGLAEENIQARCRGIILMGLSNKFGGMVLATGNKSEMAVGYSTLYGDLCGGYAPLKDVYKTEVYRMARWRNANRPAGALGPEGPIIPENIFTKAPTAELRPNQKDQDSLPPYDTLDSILSCLIEGDMGFNEIVAQGYDAAMVEHVWRMLDRAEYKRRQAPPGPKITRRHLTRDRRYPITNGYVEKRGN